MELITAECLWLRCCNCGATYEDVWPNIHKEEPVCSFCGETWYINTEKYGIREPTNLRFRRFSVCTSTVSSRWKRYQKLISYLEKLPVDEQVAHDTAWRLSVSEKINMIYAAQIAFRDTIRYVLGWRGRISYQEVSWPVKEERSEAIPWEEISMEMADTSRDTEAQAIANMDLEVILKMWSAGSNSGLTLWEAMALRSPGSEVSIEDQRFYKRVKVQLHRLRKRISNNV